DQPIVRASHGENACDCKQDAGCSGKLEGLSGLCETKQQHPDSHAKNAKYREGKLGCRKLQDDEIDQEWADDASGDVGGINPRHPLSDVTRSELSSEMMANWKA